jgi:hypothetical protein
MVAPPNHKHELIDGCFGGPRTCKHCGKSELMINAILY